MSNLYELLYELLIYGTDYEEVSLEHILSRPRYQHLNSLLDDYYQKIKASLS